MFAAIQRTWGYDWGYLQKLPVETWLNIAIFVLFCGSRYRSKCMKLNGYSATLASAGGVSQGWRILPGQNRASSG
ncbi:hypothetical protein ACFOD9_06790 [Novosphingobium bradum]|uniref:Uncharacterized protein n=1 Tax=Novosphingobium bradum TaxID=1737444 RepID=A0ABV7IRW0_9SPHN